MGQPPEAVARSCLLATGLARRMRLGEREVADVYFVTLLQHAGFTAIAHETATLFGGDDMAVRAGGARRCSNLVRAQRPSFEREP